MIESNQIYQIDVQLITQNQTQTKSFKLTKNLKSKTTADDLYLDLFKNRITCPNQPDLSDTPHIIPSPNPNA